MGAVRTLSGQKIAMHGKDVCLEGVSITYPNGFTAVKPTDLTIGAGAFFSILGPSGCGKTTILRAVSGFVEPSAGRVLIGGEDQPGIGPNGRPTALIFQNLALFPLMPVWENVAFGLESRAEQAPEGRTQPANRRNGSSQKTVATDSGKAVLDIPRDGNGTFDPLLIAKYQRRFPEFDR